MTPRALTFRELVEAAGYSPLLTVEETVELAFIEEGLIGDAWDKVVEFFKKMITGAKGFFSGGLDRASIIASAKEAGIENADSLIDHIHEKRGELDSFVKEAEVQYPRAYKIGRLFGKKLVGVFITIWEGLTGAAKWAVGDIWNNKYWGGGVLLYLALAGIVSAVPGGLTVSPQLGISAFQAALGIGAIATAVDIVSYRIARLFHSSEDVYRVTSADLDPEHIRPSEFLHTGVEKFVKKLRKWRARHHESLSHNMPLTEAELDEGIMDFVRSIFRPLEGFFKGLISDPSKLTKLADYLEEHGIKDDEFLDRMLEKQAEDYMDQLEGMGWTGKVIFKIAEASGNWLRRFLDFTLVPLIRVLRKNFTSLAWLREDMPVHLLFAMLYNPSKAAGFLTGLPLFSLPFLASGFGLAPSMMLSLILVIALYVHGGRHLLRFTMGHE